MWFNVTSTNRGLPATFNACIMTKMLDQQSNFAFVISLSYIAKVLRRCQKMLLEMATPDAIARLPATGLEGRARHIWNAYFAEQQHSSLAAYMSHVLTLDDIHLNEKRQEGLLIQVSQENLKNWKDSFFIFQRKFGFYYRVGFS